MTSGVLAHICSHTQSVLAGTLTGVGGFFFSISVSVL